MTARKNENDISYIIEHGFSIQSREIYLGWTDNDVDAECALDFIKKLRILDKLSDAPIVIHQYSMGGDWSAGMCIYDAIVNSRSSFVFLTYGCAASTGSIVPQAVYGKGYRVTYKMCDWCIHEGTLTLDGSSKGVTSAIEVNSRNTSDMYKIYTEVCKNTGSYFENDNLNKVKSFLKRKLNSRDDWWITSEEAVLYGFADGILGTPGYEDIETIKGSL